MDASTTLDGRGNTMLLNSSKVKHCGKYVTPEITADILSRLPVKSVVRFRCVCKSWPSIISDPDFILKHQNRAIAATNSTNSFKLFVSTRPLLSIDHNDGVVETRELDPPRGVVSYLRILGSCNGLICLEVDNNRIILWNPCTRETKVLSEPPSDDDHFYGFGYDSSTQDYKLIRGVTAYEKTVIEVFSLKSNSWRTFEDENEVSVHEQGCLFNGALHWAELRAMNSKIFSFDLADEKFKEMVPLPSCANRDCMFAGIGTSRNRLFVYTDPIDDTPFTIWMMEEYGVQESWTRVLQISLDILAQELYAEDNEIALRPLCILENGDVLMDYDGMELVLYNHKEQTFEDITEDDGENYCFEAATYVETLVSPVTGSGGADM